jgi:hypothetical protein
MFSICFSVLYASGIRHNLMKSMYTMWALSVGWSNQRMKLTTHLDHLLSLKMIPSWHGAWFSRGTILYFFAFRLLSSEMIDRLGDLMDGNWDCRTWYPHHGTPRLWKLSGNASKYNTIPTQHDLLNIKVKNHTIMKRLTNKINLNTSGWLHSNKNILFILKIHEWTTSITSVTHRTSTEPFGRAWVFAETEFCNQS